MTQREQPNDYRQLEQAIATLEAQRAVLGDAVVDASIAALREKLAALEGGPPASRTRQALDQELRGERRTITAMFADVKGSTSLAEQIDVETWVEIMNHVLQVLSTEIHRFGGEVDRYEGDGLVAFFGASAAHEDDPERAVLAALAMQQAVQRYAGQLEAERGIELLLRVGLSTGEVVTAHVDGARQHGEETAMGRAIAVAARMEPAAEPGTVLVSEDTYRLVAPLFDWQPMGAVAAKGIRAPVPAYRPLAHRATTGKVRGIPGLESPLVGREAELHALQGAIERLRVGVGGIVTLVGEAGIGKSRLVAELRGSMERSLQPLAPDSPSIRWVEGRCLSYGTAIAYLLCLDVLRTLLGTAPDASPTAARDALREHVQALCPDRFDDVYPYLVKLMSLPMAEEDEDALRGLDGESLQLVTFRAIESFIGCTALQQPLVVVCEDLHWADPTSIEVLERLLALIDYVPLLLLCVFRPEMEHGCWRIRETAARLYHHRHTDLRLDALSATEGETLVGNLLLVEDLTPGLRERILDHAEGNPFYVEEILRSLIDSGAIAYDERNGCWQATREVADIALPDTLHGVLMARIDRLQEETRRVLQLAAVIGRVFLYRVLAEIAREERALDVRLVTLQRAQEERALDVRLVTLQRAQLIRERARVPELEYIFKHHLTQEAAYNGLLKRERRIYHRQVAEALERLYPDRLEEQLGLLAYHWEQAGETAQAVVYLRRAGEQAAAQYANAEAADYFSRSLALTPREDLVGRYTLLLARERVYGLQGDREAQSRDLTDLEALVDALDDVRRRAEVALQRARYAQEISDYPAAVKAAQETIGLAQVARDAHIEAAGHLQWGQALWRQGENDPARAQLERALALARTSGFGRLEADGLTDVGRILLRQGDYAGAIGYCEQALPVYRSAGDRRGEGTSLNILGAASREQGDLARAKRYLEQTLQISREIGDRQGEGRVLSNLGVVSCDLGDIAGARTYGEQALRVHRQVGDRQSEGTALCNLCDLLNGQGSYAEAMTVGEQALQTFRQIGHRFGEGFTLTCLSLLSHHLGSDQDAEEYARQALLVAQELGARPTQAYALANLGHAQASLGRTTEAVRAYEGALDLWRELGQAALAMESLAGLARVSVAQGDLVRAQAQVEEILSHLETSTLDGADEPFRVYLTCYRVLRANEDPRARDILRTAHDLLQEQATKIGDEALRSSFLENVVAHREIVEAFRRLQE